MKGRSRTWGAALAVLFSLAVGVQNAQASLEEEIFGVVEAATRGDDTHMLSEPVRAGDVIHLFYARRDYRPAWEGRELAESILDILGASSEQGLDPEDYHYSALRALVADYDSGRLEREAVRARFDVLLSDGVLLYGRHLRAGKVDPARFEDTWNYAEVDYDPERLSKALTEAIAQGGVPGMLRDFEPDLRFYQLLKAELRRYRELNDRYPFQTVPSDTVLRPGQRHANVDALRRQLQRLELVEEPGADPELFDQELESAVRRFQALHGLDADGVVGRNTFVALNTPYSDRIDQIRINLDRVRWVRNEIPEDFVVVNIAGYQMYYFRNQDLHWTSDVMVGTIKHQTPFFRADMKYMVLNPDWTVPRSIIRRSLFPKMKADPGYVDDHNYKLFNSDGDEVDPQQLDWDSYSPGRFPYRVVQQPGPLNALGQVKFIFPNRYAIYLHDTPSRSLFSKTTRAFSAGCIRVRDPLDFAELLLEDQPKWSRAAIDDTIAGGRMQVVHLKKPLEVMLMYWTASPSAEGRIQLHPDIYSRDAAVLAALGEVPRWGAGSQ